MRYLLLVLLFISSIAYGQSTFIRSGLTSGTDTYTLSVTSLSSYSGVELPARFSNTNTGAATVNINGLGAIEIRKWNGTAWVALTGSEINTTTIYRLSYTSVGPYFQLHQDGGSGGAWGSITGTLSNQTDLQSALDAKQATLVSGTNIRTVEGNTLLASGNVDITKSDVGLSNVDNTSDANKPVSTAQQTALDLKENTANKATDLTSPSNTTFPTTLAVANSLASLTTNPGVNFAPAQSFDPTFVVYAVGIFRPSNTYSVGNPITWEILDQSTSHNSSFFSSATVTGGNNALTLNYPTVRMVLNMEATVDESFARYGVLCGPTVGTSSANIEAYRTTAMSIRLRGQSSTTWSVNGLYSNQFTFGTISAGLTGFNVTGSTSHNVDYTSMAINYIGTNNYGIRRVYSGLGANNIGFMMVDRFTGSDVTTNPTSSDEILITNAGMYPVPLPMQIWTTNNQFMTGPSSPVNFWVFAAFECWMVTVPISTTSIQVRWQPTYTSATTYKIYRDTQASFATQVLIHTGTSGSFLDTGLTANTLYYYKYVPVVGGVDQNIGATFKTNTKAF